MMLGEEDAPKKPRGEILLGGDISNLSVFELEARIETLRAEIARTEDAITSRQSTRGAADAMFRR